MSLYIRKSDNMVKDIKTIIINKINKTSEDIEPGCDTCYYESFDENAYPCSMCIRGYERTDRFQPKIK